MEGFPAKWGLLTFLACASSWLQVIVLSCGRICVQGAICRGRTEFVFHYGGHSGEVQGADQRGMGPIGPLVGKAPMGFHWIPGPRGGMGPIGAPQRRARTAGGQRPDGSRQVISASAVKFAKDFESRQMCKVAHGLSAATNFSFSWSSLAGDPLQVTLLLMRDHRCQSLFV